MQWHSVEAVGCTDNYCTWLISESLNENELCGLTVLIYRPFHVQFTYLMHNIYSNLQLNRSSMVNIFSCIPPPFSKERWEIKSPVLQLKDSINRTLSFNDEELWHAEQTTNKTHEKHKKYINRTYWHTDSGSKATCARFLPVISENEHDRTLLRATKNTQQRLHTAIKRMKPRAALLITKWAPTLWDYSILVGIIYSQA